MKKLTSLEEFVHFRHRVVKEKEMAEARPCLVLCAGTGGQASGSNDILLMVKRQILERKLQDRLSLRVTGCQGFCQMDPFIVVEPGRHLYPRLKREDVRRIIDAALEGEIVEDLLYRDAFQEACASQEEIPFFSKQTRVILGRNQDMDPIRILDYVEQGGYAALEKVLGRRDPEWVIGEIRQSGLRGRGGAGFPTGRKWELARASGEASKGKYMVCNADEGDPGAYMDRSLLEGNPHAILEGMLIAGSAIGATRGIVYVRTEYPLAIKHATIAIRQARDLGLLGRDILGTGIDFDIDIARGAGAFVCGEETALIRSIEGGMGEPRQRPPYPIEKGIWGHPTCINNVETLANVPVIIDRGASWYAKIGVPGNTGTKIFSLVGKIRNTGLVEVPLGMTIGEVVYDIGGGPSGKAAIKAVQTGGPSGGCIPASIFDLPIDYDSLTKAGTIMGSGGMIVMDENTCMIDVARYFMGFLRDESCGKCFTCRKGTQRMYELLDDIATGRGTLGHLDLLEELARVVKDTALCGLGQSAANPILSTLRYFRNEYEAHILKKRCDAFVCKELTGAPCQTACPLGTEAWRYTAHIQRGEYEEAYRVIREANPFPSVCSRVCHHPCEERCRAGAAGSDPVAIRALKRFVTDRVNPSTWRPLHIVRTAPEKPKVAVVGAGPSGLSAAHALSLAGHPVMVFEAEGRPGGMLLCGIPPYRLPRDVLGREIGALFNENVTLRVNTALGRNFTLDNLFEAGFKAVFLAIGAHRSRRLGIEGEDLPEVYPAMQFLKAVNLRGERPARGRVGVIGGGNSAIDAGRVALRQDGVSGVTIFYRRGRQEMPAFAEEIEEALREGVKIEPLVSPVRGLGRDGHLTGVEFVRTRPGDCDVKGRRSPLPVPGTEFILPLDTLIVAIGEEPGAGSLSAMGVQEGEGGRILADPETFLTARAGVFAAGDAARGANTVVEAIADGKKAAVVIGQYLRGEPLRPPSFAKRPGFYIEQPVLGQMDFGPSGRASPRHLSGESRTKGFAEVESPLSVDEATREAGRCLRCDLEFTRPAEDGAERLSPGEKKAWSH